MPRVEIYILIFNYGGVEFMGRRDDFKNHYQNEMTATDLDYPQLYNPKWRGKAKKKFRKMARARLKNKLIELKEEG